MKVLILILSCKSDSDLYTINNGISKTWNSIILDDAPTFHYFGGANHCNHDCSSINTTCNEQYNYMGVRTIETFEYALNNFEFDYLFRTNISSYINKKNLIAWLSNKNKLKFYSGVIGDFYGRKFASGSGFTLSRDLVEYLCASKNKLNYNLVDDVCFGDLLTNTVDIVPAPRLDFYSEQSVSDFDENNFHFRCKSFGDRATDSKIMNLIHKKFYKL